MLNRQFDASAVTHCNSSAKTLVEAGTGTDRGVAAPARCGGDFRLHPGGFD
jgi:hypothetical protein